MHFTVRYCNSRLDGPVGIVNKNREREIYFWILGVLNYVSSFCSFWAIVEMCLMWRSQSVEYNRGRRFSSEVEISFGPATKHLLKRLLLRFLRRNCEMNVENNWSVWKQSTYYRAMFHLALNKLRSFFSEF